MRNIEQEIIEKEETLFKERQELRKKEKELVTLKSTLREETIREQFYKFLKKQNKNIQNSVYLNNDLLHAAIVSYYYDIRRYKEFAGSKWVNDCKKAAYTIKWIAKFRPIQIKEEESRKITKTVFDINLIFALLCGFSFLDKSKVDLIMKNKVKADMQNKNKKENEEKVSSFYDNLLYIIRYRPLSGKQLISIFDVLELSV